MKQDRHCWNIIDRSIKRISQKEFIAGTWFKFKSVKGVSVQKGKMQ